MINALYKFKAARNSSNVRGIAQELNATFFSQEVDQGNLKQIIQGVMRNHVFDKKAQIAFLGQRIVEKYYDILPTYFLSLIDNQAKLNVQVLEALELMNAELLYFTGKVPQQIAYSTLLEMADQTFDNKSIRAILDFYDNDREYKDPLYYIQTLEHQELDVGGPSVLQAIIVSNSDLRKTIEFIIRNCSANTEVMTLEIIEQKFLGGLRTVVIPKHIPDIQKMLITFLIRCEKYMGQDFTSQIQDAFPIQVEETELLQHRSTSTFEDSSAASPAANGFVNQLGNVSYSTDSEDGMESITHSISSEEEVENITYFKNVQESIYNSICYLIDSGDFEYAGEIISLVESHKEFDINDNKYELLLVRALKQPQPNFDVIQYLIEALKAQVNVRDPSGLYVMDYAQNMKKYCTDKNEIISYLQELNILSTLAEQDSTPAADVYSANSETADRAIQNSEQLKLQLVDTACKNIVGYYLSEIITNPSDEAQTLWAKLAKLLHRVELPETPVEHLDRSSVDLVGKEHDENQLDLS